MLKKILPTFLIIAQTFTLFSQQSLNLSFEATHYEGVSVGLDSILIMNINRNCDTVLYSPDTVLLYNFFVGMDEKLGLENSFISNSFPNPAINNKTNINVNLNKTGLLSFELFDLMGRKLLSQSIPQQAGVFKYQFKLANGGTFILKAIFENQFQSIKIINNDCSKGGNFSIDLISEQRNNRLKNEKAKGGFWYEPGDTLWYVGYAKTPQLIAGSDVLEGVPNSNEHINFTIVEGLPCPDNVAVKYAGQLYATVQIDDNCWFKENLNVGKMIPGTDNMSDDGIIEKFCYDNKLENCQEYGGLYQWNELMNYTEHEEGQGICPGGWHIATKDELFSLVEDFDGLGCKERGNKHWENGYNVGGDNNKGFTALGSGYRQNTTLFEQLGTTSAFHSSTKLTNNYVWYIELNKNNYIGIGSLLKICGNAVRCVKD
jgi:uncharacterized protein (TIGR02145 family)